MEVRKTKYAINDVEEAKAVFRRNFSERLDKYRDYEKKSSVSKKFDDIFTTAFGLSGGEGFKRSNDMMKEIEKAENVPEIERIAKLYSTKGKEGPQLIRISLDEIKYGITPEIRNALAEKITEESNRKNIEGSNSPNDEYIQSKVNDELDKIISDPSKLRKFLKETQERIDAQREKPQLQTDEIEMKSRP